MGGVGGSLQVFLPGNHCYIRGSIFLVFTLNSPLLTVKPRCFLTKKNISAIFERFFHANTAPHSLLLIESSAATKQDNPVEDDISDRKAVNIRLIQRFLPKHSNSR